MRDASEHFEPEREREFRRVFRELAKCFPDGIRRPGRKGNTPLNLFEGVSVGAALALRKRERLTTRNIERWLGSEELRNYTTEQQTIDVRCTAVSNSVGIGFWESGMFAPLRTEVEARFEAIEHFFQATGKLDGDLAATTKGLMFVQVYAVYEFTVRSVVRSSIDSIKTYRHQLKHVSPSMMALLLSPEWDALRDGGRKSEWDNRLKIMERAFSTDVIDVSSDTSLPSDGSHYRYSHLQLIFRVFGISRLPVRRRRHIQRIAEVVSHRNTIAHGQEKAEDIGRRYSQSEIRRIVRQMKSVCLLQIDVFEQFCADASRHRR